MTTPRVEAGTTPQAERTPLTYEQEIHAVLHASAANTEDLLRYFEAQAAQESKDAKKLTEKCIEWKRDDLRRVRALIPQALERREARAVAPVETPTRNSEVLADFVKYCEAHPAQRFWQALRNWSTYPFVIVTDGEKWRADTFDWEGRRHDK